MDPLPPLLRPQIRTNEAIDLSQRATRPHVDAAPMRDRDVQLDRPHPHSAGTTTPCAKPARLRPVRLLGNIGLFFCCACNHQHTDGDAQPTQQPQRQPQGQVQASSSQTQPFVPSMSATSTVLPRQVQCWYYSMWTPTSCLNQRFPGTISFSLIARPSAEVGDVIATSPTPKYSSMHTCHWDSELFKSLSRLFFDQGSKRRGSAKDVASFMSGMFYAWPREPCPHAEFAVCIFHLGPFHATGIVAVSIASSPIWFAMISLMTWILQAANDIMGFTRDPGS
ncbi:hypothetical protein EDD22DRAFT_846823 [Suillus occidentalis]|nr:hypothetical protein EDD22DRAFT_846823 [Suillus occidentalis]